jgi:aquaporin related protein
MSTSSRENSLGPRRHGLGKRHVLPDNLRNLVVLTVGEFFGTFMFLLLAFVGTQAALDTNDPSDPNAPLMPFSLLYIAASFGCSLAVNVWVFYRVTGGMFNPAVRYSLLIIVFPSCTVWPC